MDLTCFLKTSHAFLHTGIFINAFGFNRLLALTDITFPLLFHEVEGSLYKANMQACYSLECVLILQSTLLEFYFLAAWDKNDLGFDLAFRATRVTIFTGSI